MPSGTRRRPPAFLMHSALVGSSAVLLLLLSTGMVAWGQEAFPSRPIQITVPYPPGGTSDLTARFLSPRLAEILKQSVVVVNKPGGAGALGIQSVATAKPDGYAVLTSPPAIVITPLISQKPGFSLRDFAPLSLAVSTPNVITVKADAPFKTFEELVESARKNPGKLNYSSAGPGTTPHFVGELFKLETKTNLTHVPMGGEAPAVAGLLGGHVDVSFVSIGAVQKHLQAGTLRALATTYQKRLKDWPDVPTTREKGYPGILAVAWHGYFVPAKTPPEVAKKLEMALETALKDKDVIVQIEKTGMLVENLNAQEAARFLKEEEERWSRVAKAAGILAQ